MKEALVSIADCVAWYKKAKGASPDKLLEVLRVITSNLYTLENERAEYKKRYEGIIYEETKEGSSVARAQNLAEVEVPELYMLRRVMEASYRVSDAIRTQISFLKSEMSHLNSGN